MHGPKGALSENKLAVIVREEKHNRHLLVLYKGVKDNYEQQLI